MNIEGKELIIFGAGSLAVNVIRELKKKKMKLSYILDNDPKKEGEFLEGLIIKRPHEIKLNKNELILIASSFSSEIQIQLKAYGISYRSGYINFNEVVPYIENTIMKFSGKFDELNEIGTLLKYSIDEVGVLLKKEEHLYRAIYKESEEKTIEILNKLKEKNFYNNKVICADITEFSTKNFPLILKHPYLPICSDTRSWSYTMMKDALYEILELLDVLKEDNLTLKDCHTLNITYSNKSFKWIDFGSIVKGDLHIITLIQLIEYFIWPLVLMKNGKNEEFYTYNNRGKIPYLMIKTILSNQERTLFDNIYEAATNKEKTDYFVTYSLLETVKTWTIEYLGDVITNITTIWSEYQNLDNKEDQTTKQKTVLNFLREIKGETLIDIAGNNGFYCVKSFKEFGYKGVLTDYDSQCVDNAYRYFKKEKINFIPLVNDFNGFPGNLQLIKGNLKFDTVLCLAFIHHLIFSNGFTFEKIKEKLLEVTEENLIIEFIDSNDKYVSQWINPYFSWYSQENFERIFSVNFEITNKSKISDSRTIYLMKLKN